MVRKTVRILRARGPRGLADSVFRKLRRGRMRSFDEVRRVVEGKSGLEIGGPSMAIFGRLVPTYRYAASVDNCNFAATTLWEEGLVEGETFIFDSRRPPGSQFIRDASDLSNISDDTYDFVMSSHVIEHIANPIRALNEWRRVLKPGGAAILVVPHREYMFDHRRPLTTLQHMLDDFAQSTSEDDQTHLQETLDFIDYSMIPEDRDTVAELGRNVFNTRALHHHTFDEATVRDLLRTAGFHVRCVQFEWPWQIIAVALKKPVT